ncbi:metallophosphoesterase [Halorientalis litorea]|uniref:metallophosphoesterase n=1 Tax=Halorientalis litorea TaxID=2931977 RepID=UPI001FF5D060|nr:metallophosphoesterase [Halorientalis litorea]
MAVEPVPGEPAAVATLPDERALVLADYHAGLEVGLRHEGVELRSDAESRRTAVQTLLDGTAADRLVVLGDFANAIGDPRGEERAELTALLDAVSVPTTVVRGNHDGDIGDVTDGYPDVTVTPGHGVRYGSVGFAHGHTWPSPDVLRADVVCTAHEHPVVRLEDDVGGARVERVWLRGDLNSAPFAAFHDTTIDGGGELIVFPAFNDRTGGTWVNVEGQDFLAPYLPEGVTDGQAYLLDGTRLGDYRRV